VTGVESIRRIIPHRYPMLLLDRVTHIVPGERVTAVKAVTGSEPWYSDLPDDTPPDGYAYPAALLLESWCQAACLLVAWDQPCPDVGTGQVALFGGLSDLRFERPVWPGEVVEHEARLSQRYEGAFFFTGQSRVDGETVLSVGSVMTALRPVEALT
jgi:3-hydroxyacyl-[acyl-carrier-protein] dehydratase